MSSNTAVIVGPIHPPTVTRCHSVTAGVGGVRAPACALASTSIFGPRNRRKSGEYQSRGLLTQHTRLPDIYPGNVLIGLGFLLLDLAAVVGLIGAIVATAVRLWRSRPARPAEARFRRRTDGPDRAFSRAGIPCPR